LPRDIRVTSYADEVEEKLAAAVEAIEGNVSAFGRHPFRAVNSSAATAALRRVLQVEDGEARHLCRSVVEQNLGGYIEPRVSTGGLRGGQPPRRTFEETWWIDTTEMARP
jgi:hypothetical protein